MERFYRILSTYDLIDIWRHLNPHSHHFTRQQMTKSGQVQSRLEYFLISVHLLYDFVKQDILPGMKSDHSLVYITLRLENTQNPGRGFFKFNGSLLKDSVYIKEIKEKINIFKENNQNEINKGLLWDTLKCEIRVFSIVYSTAKKKVNEKARE